MIEISVLIQHHAGPTGNVLIRRRDDGLWEFPHDRLRTGETEQEAAARIAWEQLGIQVTVGKLAMIGHKKPADGTTEHIVCGNITHNTNTKCNFHSYYEAMNKWQAEPTVAGTYAWIHPTELGQYAFSGDDANFMAKYDPWVNARPIPECRMY